MSLPHSGPGSLQVYSGSFLQDSGEALLDRLGGLRRDLLSESPKFAVSRRRNFDALAALPGRQLSPAYPRHRKRPVEGVLIAGLNRRIR